ncbi:MAG: hypothetical protein LUQ32_11040 [Methanomicrobiales archaeon]|nr:hypothetical protein [Methanomicrobiales archaeon]
MREGEISTEGRETGILVAGLIIAAALFFIDPYLAGIAVILVLTLAIAFFIMGETHNLPDLACSLAEDAKGIQLVNRGNDLAVRIHVTLVPLDREFDLPELPADGRHTFPLPVMIAEAKALVSYENRDGRKFSRTYRLSATEKGDEDLLKPPFPIFGWK